MSEPIYEPTTERLYARLPEVLRRADANHEWQLKTYLSGVVDIQSQADSIIARLQYLAEQDRHLLQDGYRRPNGELVTGDTSDLVDALHADVEWLPWIGQLFGVRLAPGISVETARQDIASAAGGTKAGSKQALIDAVRSELSGDKYVVLHPNSSDTGPIGSKDEWHILIITKATETPDFLSMVPRIVEKNAKPAGVALFHKTVASPWDDVESTFATWDDWEATDWNGIEEVSF